MHSKHKQDGVFYLFVATVSLLVCAAIYHLNHPWFFPLDDAYIVLDNAKTLLTREDDSFGQPALVGSTSPAHLVIVSFLGLFLDLPLAGYVANTLASSAYALGLARLALKFYPSYAAAVAIACVGCIVGFFSVPPSQRS